VSTAVARDDLPAEGIHAVESQHYLRPLERVGRRENIIESEIKA